MDKDQIIVSLTYKNGNLQDEIGKLKKKIHALERDAEDKVILEKEIQRLNDLLDGIYKDYDEQFEEKDINLFIADERKERENNKKMEKLQRDIHKLKRQIIIRDKELGQHKGYFDGFNAGKKDGFGHAKYIYAEQIKIKNKHYAKNYEFVSNMYFSRNQAVIGFTCDYLLVNQLRDLLRSSGNGQFIYQYAENGTRRKLNPISQLIYWCLRFGLIDANKAKKLQDFVSKIRDPIMHFDPTECVKLTLDFIQKSMDEVYEIIGEIFLKIGEYN